MSEPTPARPIRPGPIDEGAWPDRLSARVCTPTSPARIHGYCVETDLARHYSFGEVALLALTGEAPSPAQGRAFEIAMVFLAPAPVAEAPTNAAVLARAIGSPAARALGVGATTLAASAAASAAKAEPLLGWLASREGPLPEAYQAVDPDERASVANIRCALDAPDEPVPCLDGDPGRWATLVSVLYGCGIRSVDQLTAVLVMARLPVLAAETIAAKKTSFFRYPLRVPDFRYEPEER